MYLRDRVVLSHNPLVAKRGKWGGPFCDALTVDGQFQGSPRRPLGGFCSRTGTHLVGNHLVCTIHRQAIERNGWRAAVNGEDERAFDLVAKWRLKGIAA